MLISFKNIRKLFKYMMKYIKYAIILFIFNPFYQENLQKFKEKKSLFQNFEMTSMEKDLLFIAYKCSLKLLLWRNLQIM